MADPGNLVRHRRQDAVVNEPAKRMSGVEVESDGSKRTVAVQHALNADGFKKAVNVLSCRKSSAQRRVDGEQDGL
jgi:hypothetical protein